MLWGVTFASKFFCELVDDVCLVAKLADYFLSDSSPVCAFLSLEE